VITRTHLKFAAALTMLMYPAVMLACVWTLGEGLDDVLHASAGAFVSGGVYTTFLWKWAAK